MADSNNRKFSIGIGGGFVTLLFQIVAFILICSIFGCEWAERSTEKGISCIRSLYK